VTYVVRLEIALPRDDADSAQLFACLQDCPPTMRLNQVVLTVTPYATRNEHPVAYEEIPQSARDHVADVLWEIKERWIADRLVEQGLPP